MRRLIVAILIGLPALVAAGTFITGNTAIPATKVQGQTPPAICVDPTKCWNVSDGNFVLGALGDLRTHTTGWINVKDYGAVGDGATDDTAAIQNAINAVPAHGGTVFFPNGDYHVNISSTVNGIPVALVIPVDRRVHLQGEGANAFFNGATDRASSRLSTTAAIWIMTVGNGTMTAGFSMDRMGFADMSASGSGGSALGGLATYEVNYITISHCTFTNFVGTGAAAVQLNSTGSSIVHLFEYNLFHQCYYGIKTVSAPGSMAALGIVGGWFTYSSAPAGSVAVNYDGDTLQAIGVSCDNYAVCFNLTQVVSTAGHRIIGCRFEQPTKGIVLTGGGRSSFVGNHFISSVVGFEALEVNNGASSGNILWPHTTMNTCYAPSPASGAVNCVKDNTATTGTGGKDTSDPTF